MWALDSAFLEVPACRPLVEPIEGVLDDDQPAARHEHALQLGQPAREVVNVMERSARDDSVEWRRIGELFDRYRLEDRALGCGRIDRDNPVAQFVKRSSEPAIAAPDLEHAYGGRRQLGCHKLEEVHVRATSSSSRPT